MMTLVTVLVVMMIAGQARALVGVKPGVRAGYYFDPEAFHIGVDADMNFTMLHFDPNIEWAFADGADIFTFNADGYMTIPLIPATDIWAGAGPMLYYINPDKGDSHSKVGLNLIAGVGLNLPLNPYGMIKYTIVEDLNGFVLGVGVRF